MQEAINDIETSDKTIITLAKDIDESINIPFGKNIEFDLQNYTITSSTGTTSSPDQDNQGQGNADGD